MYVTEDPNGERIVGTFHEKELQKTNQTEFRIEKLIVKNRDKLRDNNVMIIHLIVA